MACAEPDLLVLYLQEYGGWSGSSCYSTPREGGGRHHQNASAYAEGVGMPKETKKPARDFFGWKGRDIIGWSAQTEAVDLDNWVLAARATRPISRIDVALQLLQGCADASICNPPILLRCEVRVILMRGSRIVAELALGFVTEIFDNTFGTNFNAAFPGSSY